jgi:hypothetical protein
MSRAYQLSNMPEVFEADKRHVDDICGQTPMAMHVCVAPIFGCLLGQSGLKNF